MTAVAAEFEFFSITKKFGDLVANDAVSFSVAPRTIHGVVGENGAGKSTIMKVLYGLHVPDSGHIAFRGKNVSISTPDAAIKLGIGMVHQHFMLIPSMPVWQNIVLGKEPRKVWRRAEPILADLEKLQRTYGFSLNLKSPVEDLSVGQQQQVELLKLLYRGADLLILDEPTAVLTPQEVDILLKRLQALRDSGKTVVLITHKLKEILNVTQHVTVMRQGRVVGTADTKSLTEKSLAELMVGRAIQPLPENRPPARVEARLTVDNLKLDSHHKPILDNLNFSVKAGEIVGIAGIEGNGQQELSEIISHVRRHYTGTVTLGSLAYDQVSTYRLRQSGFAVIPADRLREAAISDFSVWENFVLGHHLESKFVRAGLLSLKKILAQVIPFLEQFDVRPFYPRIRFSALSGGNQQKVVVSREMNHTVKFLLASHPTRGVDIGAISSIHKLFLKLREEGAAILLISSELTELLALSDRILVMFEGRIVGEAKRGETDEIQLGRWMTAGKADT